MPKAAQYRVVWSSLTDNYQLHYPDGNVSHNSFQEWSEWLKTCSSFSFEGQHGRLNLLKEKRGEETYWYAYRRQGRSIFKKYAGRTTDVTARHLEELANLLNLPQQASVVQAKQKKNPLTLDSLLLLAPKLSLPRLHSDLIPRQQLLSWLDNALKRKLTIISAPAGYGKTTLVRQWIEKRLNPNSTFPSIGWLSLDAADNDPERFWRYLIAACQKFEEGLGKNSLAALQTFTQPPFEPQSWETILVSLLNELNQLKEGGIIVLEDFHTITSPYLYQSFEFFLDHLPSQFHVIIISRTVPLLPLARWRAVNELGELGRADLRFQSDETRLFLEQNLKLTLPVEIIKQLDQKLEGWAAGLRLVTLALHGRLEAVKVINYLENFEITNQRTILEYFVNEVLKAQPIDMQDFLLRTSLLDHLTSSLCEAVTAQPESQKLLDYLVNANLFLEVSDAAGQWYRYHALFAEAMRYEARLRLGPASVAEVLNRAGQWYEEQGRLQEAVESFLVARQLRRAAALIEQIINNQPWGGRNIAEVHTFRRWVEQLSQEVLNEHPAIQLNYAFSLLFAAMTSPPSPLTQSPLAQSIEQAVTKAEVGFRSSNNFAKLGEVMAFRALLMRRQGAISEAVEYAAKALEWLPSNESGWRSLVLGVLGSAAYYAGNLATARTQLLEGGAIAEVESNRGYLRANVGMLSRVDAASGDLRQAAFYMNSILKEAREEGDLDDIAHSQIGLAQLSYEWNNLDEAQQQAQEAFDLAQHFADAEIEVEAVLTLARIEQALGQPEAAIERISSLLVRLQPHLSPILYLLYNQAKTIQAWLSLQTNENFLADQWRQNFLTQQNEQLPLLEREHEAIMAARILIATGQIQAALTALQTLLVTAQAGGRRRHSLEIQLLLALAYFQLSEPEKAIALVKEVAMFTKPQGYVRLFLDQGPLMKKLLAQTIKTLAHEKTLEAYLKTLIMAFSNAHQEAYTVNQTLSLPEPLSRQEEKVLRLLAAGQTNPQIARELVVSVNTVRTQVQSIYHKLDVNNRQAAGEVARHLHLL